MNLENIYKSLREGAKALALLNGNQKNAALESVKIALAENKSVILAANEKDVAKAREKGMKESLVDRLKLTNERIDSIINGIDSVIRQPDPIGEIVAGWNTNNGLNIRQVRVPMGVAAVIYESRPNVTVDVFALAYKSGNAVLLRGSSSALESNRAILKVIKSGLENCKVAGAGIPLAIELADSGDHAEVDEILSAKDYIDVVLPRGGANLIKTVVEKAKMPVIETGSGICHAFVDESADFEMAANIAANGKLQRPGVCNAIECLLVHEKAAKEFLPKLVAKFDGKSAFRCDEASYQIVMEANNQATNKSEVSKAIPEDFDTEFLDYILAIKTVSSTEEAVDFINAHNTKHSETIITKNTDNAKTFQAKVDASCVYVNASTRFTDGEMFGFGAELGISTQKMHIRGPMGLKALTTTKYLIDGEGQIR